MLQGNTPGRQSLVIRALGLALTDRGYSVHYFHRADDHLMVEGLTVPSQKFGMLSGNHPYAIQELFPIQLETVIVELPGGIVPSYLGTEYEKVLKLVQTAGEIYHSVSKSRSKTADQYTVGAGCCLEELKERPTYLRRYFAGSVSRGLDYPDILEYCRKRYVIKGPVGAGAVVMHDILIQALCRRYVVEVYHSILEPLDLVVLFFPEIGVAVVNGTCCYNELSLVSGDTVWDLGKELVLAPNSSGTDYEEIKLKLAEAGKELDKYHKKLEKGGLMLTSEEIEPIVSRIIKDIDN